MASDAETFVRTVMGNVPPGFHALLWTRQDKQSTWIDTSAGPAAIARAAVGLAKQRDVYLSVSVAAEPGRAHRRISADSAKGIFALWADIDIAAPDVHKKWNLPPDEEAARGLLKRAGIEPTVLVHSGHGLQAWWVFREFWEFDTPMSHSEAATLAQKWNATLRVRAAEQEWTLDSTFDLARVMRVPGTTNFKGAPVPVRLLSCEPDRQFTPEDFDPYLVDDRMLATRGLTPTRTYQVGEISLNPKAEPPFEKFEALRANDPNFEASWTRSRSDLADQSGSSYDLSLATIASNAGWDDQEIIDLLIASRRRAKDDLKLRVDYYARTIAKARDSTAREIAYEHIEDAVDDLQAARRAGDDDEVRRARRNAYDAISPQLGLEVVQVIKYTSEPPSYRLVTPTHTIDLGSAGDILSQAKFREAVVAATEHQIPRFKTPTWDRLTQAIFHACEMQDVGLEATGEGQTYSWITGFISSNPPVGEVDEAAATESPWIDDTGAVCIFGPALKRYLWVMHGERVTDRELGKRLRQYGATPFRQAVNTESGRTSRSAWALPPRGRGE